MSMLVVRQECFSMPTRTPTTNHTTAIQTLCIFLGNGSDEAIDLPYRCFCNPGKDNVVAIEPTYGMYKVCADINDVEYRPVLLDDQYQITANKLLAATDDHTKIIWLCTPNNPTGNCLNRDEVVKVIEQFEGLVIVDEAYSDFASQRSLRFDLAKYLGLCCHPFGNGVCFERNYRTLQ